MNSPVARLRMLCSLVDEDEPERYQTIDSAHGQSTDYYLRNNVHSFLR